jgi:hypothetical protein
LFDVAVIRKPLRDEYTNMLKFANKAYELAPSNSYASLGYHVACALSFITNNDSAQAQVEWNYSLDGNVSDIWTFNRKLGFVYSLKGDVELALENLKTSLEKPYDIFLVYRYLYDPDLDNVRNDPKTKDRFAEFLEKVKATYPALGKK